MIETNRLVRKLRSAINRRSDDLKKLEGIITRQEVRIAKLESLMPADGKPYEDKISTAEHGEEDRRLNETARVDLLDLRQYNEELKHRFGSNQWAKHI